MDLPAQQQPTLPFHQLALPATLAKNFRPPYIDRGIGVLQDVELVVHEPGNGVAAAFTVLDVNFINATVPAGATTGPITVSTAGGPSTSTQIFTVQ